MPSLECTPHMLETHTHACTHTHPCTHTCYNAGSDHTASLQAPTANQRSGCTGCSGDERTHTCANTHKDSPLLHVAHAATGATAAIAATAVAAAVTAAAIRTSTLSPAAFLPSGILSPLATAKHVEGIRRWPNPLLLLLKRWGWLAWCQMRRCRRRWHATIHPKHAHAAARPGWTSTSRMHSKGLEVRRCLERQGCGLDLRLLEAS